MLPPSPDSSSSSESDVDVRAGYTFRFPAREGPPTAKDVRRAAHNPLAALYRLWDGSGQGENDVAPPDLGMTAEEYAEIETRCLEGFNRDMNPYEPEVGCACCGERCLLRMCVSVSVDSTLLQRLAASEDDVLSERAVPVEFRGRTTCWFLQMVSRTRPCT